MAIGAIVSEVSGVKFLSNIFKKPQTKEGYKKFCETYANIETRLFVPKFISGEPMYAWQFSQCAGFVRRLTQNWTKAQKKDIEDHLKQVKIIPEPKKSVLETHTLSASYNKEAIIEGIQKSRDVNEPVLGAMLPGKINPILLLLGIGALLLFFKRGGAK